MSFQDWIELESDPGLFTLLVYDFGVKNVGVEEVYDLSKPIDRVVHGFIFLFKWTEERKSRRKTVYPEENYVYNEEMENDMFFAQQIIPNSCASHALLSVLLNIPDIPLGYTLTQLRDSCKGFDPETKGYAIGNFWNIAVAHNNHGRRELRWQNDRLKNVTATRSMETFHYVSYIPYGGRLFELDGLKPRPIDHGPWLPGERWSGKARRVIQERIQAATGGELSHDIRYNLLAVVPEQRQLHRQKCEILSHNKKVLIELFKRLASKESFVSSSDTHSILKNPDLFPHGGGSMNSSKKVSFGDHPHSPQSSCSSTLTGIESPSRPFSDSEDSSVESYRIKAVLRGEMKGPVYVYGANSNQDVVKTEENSPKDPSEYNSEKEEMGDSSENVVIASVKEEFCDDPVEVKRMKIECDNKTFEDEINASSYSVDQSKDILPIDGTTSCTSISNNAITDTDLNSTFPYDDIYSGEALDGRKGSRVDSAVNVVNDGIIKEHIKTEDAGEVLDGGNSLADKCGGEQISAYIDRNISTEEGHEDKFLSGNAKDVHWNVDRDVCIEENMESMKYLEKHRMSMLLKKEIEYDEADQSSEVRPGLGVEIIADDADIDSLLEQNQMKKLSLSELLKYEDKIKLSDLQKTMQDIDEMYKSCAASYKEELEKINRYKIDDCRRRHNYDPFVSTFLTMLAEQGHLARLLEEQNTIIRRVSTATLKGNGNKKDQNRKKKKIKKGVVKK